MREAEPSGVTEGASVGQLLSREATPAGDPR